jgi:hypothetical protein
MQEEKACLSRNRDPDLVSHFKTTASLEVLLRQKDLNMAQQLNLIRLWKSPKDSKIARNYRTPGSRKWLPLQFPAAPLFQKPQGHAGISDLLIAERSL